MRRSSCSFGFSDDMISIHAPRIGMRLARKLEGDWNANFNPRTPYRDATLAVMLLTACSVNFNPRTPYRDATIINHLTACLNIISIHAPRIGMRQLDIV